MEKQPALLSGVDLKRFFEASVGALQSAADPTTIANPTARGRSSLVPRSVVDGAFGRRALADAARALTTLWKMNLKEPI